MIKNQCIQCSTTFVVTDQDQAFYQKIQVPTPTLCPNCRAQRRMVWRNERTLYSRTCDLCKKNIISIYDAASVYTVYCYDCWYSDKWNPLDYHKDIDFSRPFFDQFKELQLAVPRLYAFAMDNENSEYTNGSFYNKNSYLIFVSDHNEDAMYCYWILYCKQVLDCLNTTKSELCYECIGCSNCYATHYSIDCANCNSSSFLLDCKGCQNCFMSNGLRNKQYVWRNQQLTGEEYQRKLASLRQGSYEKIEQLKNEFEQLKKKHCFKYYHGLNSESSSGDYLERCSNSRYCFESNELDNSSYIVYGNKSRDCHDCYVAVDQSELCYEVTSAISLYNVQFSYSFWTGRDAMYCDSCVSSNNIFGCVGLRKQQYCILNTEHSETSFGELRIKIIEHMKKTGEYGEYFPIALSPFGYNETVAQDQYPLTKDQILANGWKWKESKNIAGKYNDYRIFDNIVSVKDDIVKETLSCEKCYRNYRILPQELTFYRSQSIPIPRLCYNCRHIARLQQKNPRALWQRQCMCTQLEHGHKGQCSVEFATTYSDKNPTIVYCEECYTKEMN